MSLYYVSFDHSENYMFGEKKWADELPKGGRWRFFTESTQKPFSYWSLNPECQRLLGEEACGSSLGSWSLTGAGREEPFITR